VRTPLRPSARLCSQTALAGRGCEGRVRGGGGWALRGWVVCGVGVGGALRGWVVCGVGVGGAALRGWDACR